MHEGDQVRVHRQLLQLVALFCTLAVAMAKAFAHNFSLAEVPTIVPNLEGGMRAVEAPKVVGSLCHYLLEVPELDALLDRAQLLEKWAGVGLNIAPPSGGSAKPVSTLTKAVWRHSTMKKSQPKCLWI